MKTAVIREKFFKYFESKGHKKMSSGSLVPLNDQTLLFTNAGMVQFKDEFTGKSNPPDKRVVTVQKCVRAGGKHNDLENVGFTSRHHTFFEMMGNFSFGDYFKKEAISFAWEFLTVELGISKEKLYVTVHHSDREAADIWHLQEGIPRNRIFFRGDKDNFWEMGEVGPCGPCSEIFYDHGEAYSDPKADTSECLLEDEDRYVEIWNLVFMQYERYKESEGEKKEIKQRPLPNPCVDTGSGLERVAAVMQNVYNNFDTDAFSEIISKIEVITGKKYRQHPMWMRVVADHARSATMLLADGVIPANEGRGYVLRRIIRRAVRHLDLLGVNESRFYQLVGKVTESLGKEYADNLKNVEFIVKYLKLEEVGFRQTLRSGLKFLELEIHELLKRGEDILRGEKVFVLYDTRGFPVDLTEMILREQGLKIDLEGFHREMEKQKKRSKKGGDFSSQSASNKEFYAIKESFGECKFLDNRVDVAIDATLIGKVSRDDQFALVFDCTPFYAEGGGQQGDIGEIYSGEKLLASVDNTTRPVEGIFAHFIKSHLESKFTIGQEYSLKINMDNRKKIMSNHTATHLLQAALIKVLGGHVMQAGSNVGASRLRFDFTHPESVNKEQIRGVENIVNNEIRKQTEVSAMIMSKEKAIGMGAMALFGEKYGSSVRVIDVPGFSIELCGGTHVGNTGDIGFFKIISESSLASGVRRIEAITSMAAFDFVNSQLSVMEELEILLNVKGEALISKVTQLQNNLKTKNKEINSLKEKWQSNFGKNIYEDVRELSGGRVFKYFEAQANEDMKKLGDQFINKFGKGIILITQEKGERLSVLLKTFKNNKELNCSLALSELMKTHGGKGGGREDMAQGSLELNKKSSFIKELGLPKGTPSFCEIILSN